MDLYQITYIIIAVAFIGYITILGYTAMNDLQTTTPICQNVCSTYNLEFDHVNVALFATHNCYCRHTNGELKELTVSMR